MRNGAIALGDSLGLLPWSIRINLGTEITSVRRKLQQIERSTGIRSLLPHVGHDLMHLTSFGDDSTEPPIPEKSIDDALFDEGNEVLKQCPSPVGIRTLTAAGGLLPASTAFTAIRTIFPRPLFSWSLGEETKGRNDWTSFSQLAPLCWRGVIQTKSRQTLVFDPDCWPGHLRGCPFLGGRHALLSGYVRLDAAMVTEAEAFLVHGGLEHHFQLKTSDPLRRTYCS